ncbi:hypothetical protein [Scytonema sp. PRP1]
MEKKKDVGARHMVSPALREGFPPQVTGEPGGCVSAAARSVAVPLRN